MAETPKTRKELKKALGDQSLCSECGKAIWQVILCDESDAQWCPECFDKTSCAADHGEGCATLVTETPDARAVDCWLCEGYGTLPCILDGGSFASEEITCPECEGDGFLERLDRAQQKEKAG